MTSYTALSLIGILVNCCKLITQVSGQCTFYSTFSSSTWHDNTKGTLTFTTSGMSGWGFTSIRDTGTSTIQQWQCVEQTTDNYLILRTQSTFLFQTVSTTTSVYGYLCLQLTNVTSVSFIYYQQQVQEINLGGERIKVSSVSTLTRNDVCDTTVTVPTTEYHVLVKSGSETEAAIQCPDAMLFRADYTYTSSDGSTACTGSADTWDSCTDKTQITFNYNTCSQQIAFSADGNFYCVANIRSNGYDYTTLYNRDMTLSASTSRFACMSFGGSSASVAPGNCTAYQTPYSFPLEADQQTKIGHKLTVTNVYVDCGVQLDDTGLSGGAIAGIVISLMFVVWMWTTYVVLAIIVLVVILRGVAHYIPSPSHHQSHHQRERTVLSMTEDIHDDKVKVVIDSINITSPSNVMLNGKPSVDTPMVHTTSGKT